MHFLAFFLKLLDSTKGSFLSCCIKKKFMGCPGKYNRTHIAAFGNNSTLAAYFLLHFRKLPAYQWFCRHPGSNHGHFRCPDRQADILAIQKGPGFLAIRSGCQRQIDFCQQICQLFLRPPGFQV